MIKNKELVKIYTDGACKGNPGPGGWGAVLCFGKVKKEIFGSFLGDTTNNRMELTAVISALYLLRRPCEVIIYTDSLYVQKGISEWIHHWKKRNWITLSKSVVKNADLWKELDSLTRIHSISWQWIKGHAGQFENERADTLAKMGVSKALMNVAHRSKVNYSDILVNQ